VTMKNYKDLSIQMYDQSKDTMFTLSGPQLLKRCLLPGESERFTQCELMRERFLSIDEKPLNMSMAQYEEIFGIKDKNKNVFANPVTASRKGRRETFAHANWVALSESATSKGLSTYDYMNKYRIAHASDQTSFFSLDNGLTSVDNVWNLQALNEPGSRVPSTMQATEMKIPAVTNAMILFMLQDVDNASDTLVKANIKDIMQKVLAPALGVDSTELLQPKTDLKTHPLNSKYYTSRLFMINAYLAAMNTDDIELFKDIKIETKPIGDWCIDANKTDKMKSMAKGTGDIINLVQVQPEILTPEENTASMEGWDHWATVTVDNGSQESLLYAARSCMHRIFKTDDILYMKYTMNATEGVMLGVDTGIWALQDASEKRPPAAGRSNFLRNEGNDKEFGTATDLVSKKTKWNGPDIEEETYTEWYERSRKNLDITNSSLFHKAFLADYKAVYDSGVSLYKDPRPRSDFPQYNNAMKLDALYVYAIFLVANHVRIIFQLTGRSFGKIEKVVENMLENIEKSNGDIETNFCTPTGNRDEYRELFQSVCHEAMEAMALPFSFMLIRPNIEHNMLGVMMGRGGVEDLGATFWGQTELSVYDDGMHGKWGMSYKYHERAMVLNERNLIRHWDVAFNGYNGGCDDVFVDWNYEDPSFGEATNDLSKSYDGPSIMGMVMPDYAGSFPNPIIMSHGAPHTQMVNMDPEGFNSVYDERMAVFSNDSSWSQRYMMYASQQNFPCFEMLHATRKPAGTNSQESVTEVTSVAFQGTIHIKRNETGQYAHTRGAGHLGDSYVGIASVREGKGFRQDSGPSYTRAV
jgi:hypothetical protein